MGVVKRCLAVVYVLVMCLAMSSMVYANEAGFQSLTTTAPILRWTNADVVDVSLSVKGSTALCEARIVGKPGTEKITATAVLARRNSNGSYTTVKTWSNLSASGDSLYFDETYHVLSGYGYRLTVDVTVYRKGNYERISRFSDLTNNK